MTRNTKALLAQVVQADAGGFTAIASTDSLDRDGEVLAVGCFAPLPASIPVHLDHTLSAAALIGRATPYYVGNELRIDAYFASTPDAQQARVKVIEGIIDSVSVVFRALQRVTVGGVPTVVAAELLACDLVSIGSQRDARVVSHRGYGGGRFEVAQAKAALASVRRQLIDHDLAEARRTLDELDRAAPARRGSRALVEDVLRCLHYREN